MAGSELRRAILNLMRELSKTKKQIPKDEVFGMLQGQAQKDVFEQEMQGLQDDGDICQSFDASHFCLVD